MKMILQNRKIIKGVAVLFGCSLLLIGCGSGVKNTPDDSFYERAETDNDEYVENYDSKSNKIYNDAMDRLLNEKPERMEGKDFGDRMTRVVLNGYLRTYYSIRSVAPLLCICSIALGVLIMAFSIHNKQLKRLGLYGFIIGIPVTVVLFVFGVGILNGVLLY
jgi:hypothetical protein